MRVYRSRFRIFFYFNSTLLRQESGVEFFQGHRVLFALCPHPNPLPKREGTRFALAYARASDTTAPDNTSARILARAHADRVCSASGNHAE